MSAQSEPCGERTLFGILCTYRRPVEALRYLEQLEQQTQPPDSVVVVDNSADSMLAAAVTSRGPSPIKYHYLDAGSNIGPAGAFKLGFEFVERIGAPTDFVALFDDDDPPVLDTQLEQLTTALSAAVADDPRVAGMGLSGGNLNLRTGMVSSSDASRPYAIVDHLHGGYLPIYTMESLTAVRAFDATFFFGFEELELGRRLLTSGRLLLVNTAMMQEVQSRYTKKAAPTLNGNAYRRESGWSRFHKERNLIRILKRERLWLAIIFTVAFRHVLKPMVRIPRDPRIGSGRLLLGLRATLAGLRGATGIDPRYSPP